MKFQPLMKIAVVVILGLCLQACDSGEIPSEKTNNSSHAGQASGGISSTYNSAPLNGTTSTPPPAVTQQQNLNLVTSASNDELPDWPSATVRDDNSATCYSSHAHDATYNGYQSGITLAAWTSGQVTVNSVRLQARLTNGVVEGFPPRYRVYVTKPDNSAWDDLGEFSTQPDANGVVQISTGTRQTYGVLIIPITLGVDGYGVHYFQLCGVKLQ